MVAARAEHAAVGEVARRRQVDGVVGDRAKGDGSHVGGAGKGTLDLAQNPRQHAECDGSLVRATLGLVVQPCPEPPQRARLVLVTPERFELLVVGVERRLKGLDGRREHVVCEPQAPFGGKRCVGNEGCRTRRAVDQRETFLLAQIARLDQWREQMTESEDLPRAAVALQRHGRQPAVVEQ